MCETAGFESAGERQRPSTLFGREVHVSRGQGQTVRVTNRRQDAQLEVEIEVANHPPQDCGLLRVLLAEVRALRADDVEQLQANGRDAAEVSGPRGALATGVA